MANSLVNFNLSVIADETMEFFGSRFFPVTVFARDFKDEIANEGESVKTRIPGSVGVQNLSSGYTGSDVSTTAVNISLDHFKGHVAAFKDVEITKARSAKWLMDQFYEPSLEATMKALLDDAFALVLSANYSNATAKAAVDFDTQTLADLSTNLDNRKVPESERSAIMLPSYYGGVLKDLRVMDKGAFGDNEAIKKGKVRFARGFQIISYEGIPDNGQNLAGVAMHPSALAIAVRPVYKPEVPFVQCVNRVEPRTGLPFQFRLWYDANAGEFKMSCGFLYGVAVGQGDSIERITTS